MGQASEQDLRDEERRIRTLRFLTDLTVQRLSVEWLTEEEARGLIRQLRAAAGNLFPGRQHVFDLVIIPRLERIIMERFTSRN